VSRLLVLELNEVNFEFVEHYARRGALPTFARLMGSHGYSRTRSETVYEHIEPWIQWFTVHTGMPYEQHGVFRLGDGPQAGARQIWEELSQRGLKVGAFSPMNAGNAVSDAAFFVPDPWTKTRVAAPGLMGSAYEAICQAVGDNAEGRLDARSAARLALGVLVYSNPLNWPAYARLGAYGLKRRWARAVFLDRFLADCFIRLWKRTRPDFATLFLNGAAHLQHHYLFNSAAYSGPHRNPAWYLPSGTDPLLEMYRLYDRVVAECLALEPGLRVMMATGLHQDPVDEPVFYWRLRDHARFLRTIGCEFESVEPRMSRDFLVICKDRASGKNADERLLAGRAPDGEPLFEVDNRGDTLFATLSYPHEIKAGFEATFPDYAMTDFSKETVFVAIKNGRHNGIGYFLDTGGRAAPEAEPIPLAELWQRMVSAF
jgi:hypothetical protein